MADSSRSRITITLGRNGQVVKRGNFASSGSYSAARPMSGMKRSARERIGDSSLWHENQNSSTKRQRGESMQSSNYNGFDDVKIRKDDLRLKLMQKNASRQARSNDNKKHVDLREKLSQPAHSLVINPKLPHRLPVPENMRILRQAPPSRSAENLTRLESIKSSCSPWPQDHMSRRPSDQFPSTSRCISTLRNVDDLPRRTLHRTYDDIRSVPYLTNDDLDNVRPLTTRRPFGTASTSVATRPSVSAMPSIAAKPVVPPYLDQLPPSPSSVAPKSLYVGNVPQTPQTVDGLLHSLGLGKYVITFKAEEVDMTALKQMRENDLKELGIPMGPRKKIILALAPLTKRQS